MSPCPRPPSERGSSWTHAQRVVRRAAATCASLSMMSAPAWASDGQVTRASVGNDAGTDAEHGALVSAGNPPDAASPQGSEKGSERAEDTAPLDEEDVAEGERGQGNTDGVSDELAAEAPLEGEAETPAETPAEEADDAPELAPNEDDLEVDFGAPQRSAAGDGAAGDGAVGDGYDPLRDSPEALKARRWTIAGIAGTVVGAVLGAGAVATVAVDPCLSGAGNNCFEDARNRAAGIMAVPAAMMVLGGVGMIGYGAAQRRKLRASVASDGNTTMFTLQGRF